MQSLGYSIHVRISDFTHSDGAGLVVVACVCECILNAVSLEN